MLYKIIIQKFNNKNFKNIQDLTDVIYNNFIYLNQFPELIHNKNEIQRLLKSSTKSCYLATYKNKLIGYLIGEYKFLHDGKYAFFISYIYVISPFRSKNIGKFLMNKIIHECKQKNIKFIALTCYTKDTKVVDFYTKKYKFVRNSNYNRHNLFTLII